MALITLKNMQKGNKDLGKKHEKVMTKYNIITTSNGKKLLQINTLGSSNR
ncbi:hypothetical protein [uncultured Clostridium sp.]|nr:hypothetical protein [uncultured Clostridium sp.]